MKKIIMINNMEMSKIRKNEQCGEKKNESVTKILTKTTTTTWTIISTATQLICLDIEHGYDQRMRENLQTYIL